MRSLSCLLKILAISYFIFLPQEALASAFVAEMCNVTNIVTGTAGKLVAAVAVVGVGIGFFTGKVSWGLLVGVTVGIGTMFGAPSIVSAISGSPTFVCEQDVVYVNSCSNGECYSCPIGKTGKNCDVCAVGFSPPNCESCDTGYKGQNCSECDEPTYTKVNGTCQLKKCLSKSGPGISAAIPVDIGSGYLDCEGNYSGQASYVCSNGEFNFTNNNCTCPQNFNQSDCQSCAAGYQGPDCIECTSNYTKVGNSCQADCLVSGIAGIADNTTAIPPNGTLGCLADPNLYTGTVPYTCSNGVPSYGGTCQQIDSCKSAGEGTTLTLTAPAGKVFRDVFFASYGTPSSCVINTACHSNSSVAKVIEACVGKSTCTIPANNSIFGDPCRTIRKTLRVRMTY